jgi:hypothetical protein
MIIANLPDRQVQIIEDLDCELIVPEFAGMVKLTAGDVFNWLTIE